jgi:hypothetical protein
MEFRYLSAYKIQGISHNPSDSEVLICERPDLNMKAILTRDVAGHCFLLDRKLALAEMMLTGKINDEHFDEILHTSIEEIRDERRRKLGVDGALVIEGWGDVEANIEQGMRAFGDFTTCIDPIDPDPIKQRYREHVTRLIAALSIASSKAYSVEKIAEGIYLIDPTGRIIHPIFPRAGTGSVYTSSSVDQETAEVTKQYFSVLADEANLYRVSSLLVQSKDSAYDGFRRFLFAWTALEIFVNKIFSNSRRNTFSSTSKVPAKSAYRERVVKAKESGKYAILDRFVCIAAFLADKSDDADELDNDVEVFKRIKGVRDELFHGEDVLETLLPALIVEVQSLLSKYLRRYLEQVNT